MPRQSLDLLEPGQSAKVIAIQLHENEAIRLMELGLLEDSIVTMVRKAPMGDPIEYKVGDTTLSLRKAEALLVEIEI